MFGLDNLIDAIFNSAVEQFSRNERVIKLLKKFNLDPDHPPADFTGVYQYALVEYGVDKPKPVLEIFRQTEIQQLFREALSQNNPAVLLQRGEAFLREHPLGQDIQSNQIDVRREFYEFAAVFIEVAKRTRTPVDILTNQKLDSLHRQISSLQERLHRLPTIEGMRTEMARLAAQEDPALPAAESFSAEKCRAFALAQQMRGWLETLGYDFESYEVWEADYFEWIINYRIGRRRYSRALIRGVDGEIGLADVNSLQQSVDAQKADEGWLVTTRRISRAARDEIAKEENEHLGCYTFDEFLDQDADFSGYLTWLEQEIHQRGINEKYVPLSCVKEEIDPATRQRIGISRYDERDGWIDGYLDLWLDDPAKEHISILGEFGTGKTWFAFHYAWKTLQRYRDAQQRGIDRPRLPLVIPLRDYAKAVSVESLFSEFFFRKHEIPIPGYTAFEQLNRMGKLLLIFDGFDEMAARVDRQQMINNFWELAKVVVPGAKVILTCRTEHFPEAKEGRALLNAELQASTKDLTGETPQFEVLELEKFNNAQIRQVLSYQAQPTIINKIMSNPQLLDLACRPVLTELILEALPEIEAGKPVDMSRVYLYAAKHKMERDIRAERTFTSMADKLYFMCELSWEMLSTDRMSINYREFPDRIRQFFGSLVEKETDLDHWHYDMMGQTMLIRNAQGDYTPAHRSLLEFFVAYKFVAELGALASDFLGLAQVNPEIDSALEAREYKWSEYFSHRNHEVTSLKKFTSESFENLKSTFGQSKLSKAVIDLLLPIIDDSSGIFEILKSTCGKTESEVNYVGGNIATILAKSNPFFLENLDLRRAVIKGADFSNASLRGLNLAQANLLDSKFIKAFSQIFSIAIHPAGHLFATGDAAGEVRLWKTEDRSLVWNQKGHTHVVRALTFSSDGHILASASIDYTIRLWRINTGQCFQSLKGHNSAVRSVIFDTSGKLLVSGGEDHTVKVWEVQTGKCLKTISEPNGYVRTVEFSPDGQLLAYSGDNYSVKFLDTSTWQQVRILKGHTNWVKSIKFNSDKQTIATAGQDYAIKIWDVNTGECLQTLREHNSQINSVAFDSTGKLLASGSSDQTIKLWDLGLGKSFQTLHGHDNWVQAIAFTPDDQMLISGAQDHAIKLWDVHTGECLDTIQGYSNWLKCLAFSPDGNILASGGQDYNVRLWDISNERCLAELKGHLSWVQSLAFSPEGSILASSGDDYEVRLWEISTGRCIRVLKGHTRWVRTCTFSTDGELLASGSDDNTIKIWKVSTGECFQVLKGHTNRVRSVAFGVDSNSLLSCGHDDTVMIWDILSGQCINSHQCNTNWLRAAVVFSPDKCLFASGSDDYSVRLWDFKTGQCIATLQGHTGQVKAITFSIDGKLLISGSDDLTIRIWNLSKNECIKVLPAHARTVSSLAPSPFGNTFASCGEDGEISLWEIASGSCLLNLRSTRPYEGMNISETEGLTDTEKAGLKVLGAVEY